MNLMYGTNTASNLNKNVVAALSSLCTNSFITARIVCEPVIGDNGRAGLTTYINFYFPSKKNILEKEYKVFEQFYCDFNEHIKSIIKKYGLKNL